MNGLFEVKLNYQDALETALLICYNYEIGSDIVYIKYNLTERSIIEATHFTQDCYPNRYSFLSKFNFTNVSELLNTYNITPWYIDDICTTINTSKLKDAYPNISIAVKNDVINYEYYYKSIVIYDYIPIPLLSKQLKVVDVFKNKLRQLILLEEQPTLLHNLDILNRFKQHNEGIDFCKLTKNKSLYSIKLSEFTNINLTTEDRYKIKMLINGYKAIGSGISNNIDFKFINISIEYDKIIFRIDRSECQVRSYKNYDFMWDIENDPRLKYILSYMVNHPKYSRYISRLEYLILK